MRVKMPIFPRPQTRDAENTKKGDKMMNNTYTVEEMATCDYLDDVVMSRWKGNACVADYVSSFDDRELQAIALYLSRREDPDFQLSFPLDDPCANRIAVIADYIRAYLRDSLAESGYSSDCEDMVYYLKWLDAEQTVNA